MYSFIRINIITLDGLSISQRRPCPQPCQSVLPTTETIAMTSIA